LAPLGLSNSIDDQAAVWATEATYNDMSPESRAEMEAWLAADARHRGAYARVRAALSAIEEAVFQTAQGVQDERTRVPSPNNNDKDIVDPLAMAARSASGWGLARWGYRTLAGCAALAASVAALLVLGPPSAPVGSVAPSPGEKIIKLADGSVATLRHDARINVLLSRNSRRIALLSGEAKFEVAKDKTRPFVVRSGDVYAQATGTIYSVKRVGLIGGTVEVARGSVLVWSRDERDQAVLLHAGDAVTLDLSKPLPARTHASPALPPPELAQISLDNVSIRSAAARFNRVNSTKIVIADSAIGDTRIVGLFHTDDLELFAQSAAALSGGKVTHEKGEIVIKSK